MSCSHYPKEALLRPSRRRAYTPKGETRVLTRSICLCLALMLLVPAVLAFAADAETDKATLSFNELPALVLSGNPEYRGALRDINLGYIQYYDARDAWQAAARIPFNPRANTAADAFERAEANLETLKAKAVSVSVSQTLSARKTYINHFLLAAKLEKEEKTKLDLQATQPQLRMKIQLGLAPASDEKALHDKITAQDEAIKAARTALDDNLTALAKLLGLKEIRVPDAPPATDFAPLVTRKLEEDLARYLTVAPSITAARDALKTATKTYESNRNSENYFHQESARLKLEDALSTAKTEFPNTFQSLKDAYAAWLDETQLTQKRAELKKLEQQLSYGLVSKTAVRVKEDELAALLAAKETERLQLYQKWLKYLDALQLKLEDFATVADAEKTPETNI